MGIIKFLHSKLIKRRSALRHKAVVAADGGCQERDESCSGSVAGNDDLDVKRYSWEEIEKLTDNLAVVVGSGGFSTVYLARLPGSILGAVKVHYGSDRLNQIFKQELDILLKLRHHNIVRLLGYCDEPDAGALVFEYVSSGTLQEKLHGGATKSPTVLPWWARARIAFQLAQSLEYLHDNCALHIIHGDLKSSNILIDADLNCKLCDFGVAKLGFSSMVPPPSSSSLRRAKIVMVGSPGYTDPHYLKTGMASKKNDIYGFGIILLELVTGMEAFCPERGQMLAAVVAPSLQNLSRCGEEEVAEMVDPQLKGDFDVGEVRAILEVAKLCLNQSPVHRPSASRVLQVMKERIPSIYSNSSPPSTDRKKRLTTERKMVV